MSQRELGKQKVQRIDLLHYRQRTWVTWMRWSAIAVSLLFSTAYVGWVLWLDQPSSKPSIARSLQLSTGPLAQVHASFENDCQKCHASDFGIGLSPDSLQLDESARLKLQANKCGECHKEAAADPSLWHFREKLASPERDQDCARCHQDHQGRTFVMTNMANATCTECHQNLATACKAGVKSDLKQTVTDFSAESHGQVFRSLSSDTGRIKFNHAEHMQPGQVAEGHRGAFEIDFLPKDKQNRYASADRDDRKVVKLECIDCHEPLKVSDRSRANSASREEGRYYAPVSFEKHCADCHQLTFAGQKSDNLPLPHYAKRDEFNRLLSFNLRVDRLTGQVTMAADQAQNAEERASQNTTNQPIALNQSIIDEAVNSVFKRCQQCHLAEDVLPDGEDNALSRALKGEAQEMIPNRWLQYGSFNHAAHTNVTCGYCHPGTNARDEVTTRKLEEIRAADPGFHGNAVDQKIVKINGISSCLPCHRATELPDDPTLDTQPERASALGQAHQPVRASNDCTLCHRYHWTRPARAVQPESQSGLPSDSQPGVSP